MRQAVAAVLSVVVLAAGPGPAVAHSWTELSDGLTSDQIETVLSALEQMADRALAEIWEVEGGRSDPVALYYGYFEVTPDPIEYSKEIDRVLLTFEVLRTGVVRPTGEFADDADIFEWVETLHPDDVPAVAAYRGRLENWLTEMRKAAEQ